MPREKVETVVAEAPVEQDIDHIAVDTDAVVYKHEQDTGTVAEREEGIVRVAAVSFEHTHIDGWQDRMVCDSEEVALNVAL